MSEQVDWSHRADYISSRHQVTTQWANEAVADQHSVWLTPDPASRSGHAVRVIGYSPAAGTILTVILIDAGADLEEQPDGNWWGSNAWVANERDRRLYGDTDDDETQDGQEQD